ncbi:pentapeptide repeat-containing protein [soil metagenome]
MDAKYYEDKAFEDIDDSASHMRESEYVGCEFIRCNFEKADMTNTVLVDCVFRESNLSLSRLLNVGIKNVRFHDCKLVGLDFGSCSDFLFEVKFTSCHLDYSSFFQKRLKETQFTDCSLKEVDFTEADLTKAIFANCDLTRAAFVGSNLEKADFRTAKNYAFDPELNRIKGAKFSSFGIAGLLAKYDIVID